MGWGASRKQSMRWMILTTLSGRNDVEPWLIKSVHLVLCLPNCINPTKAPTLAKTVALKATQMRKVPARLPLAITPADPEGQEKISPTAAQAAELVRNFRRQAKSQTQEITQVTLTRAALGHLVEPRARPVPETRLRDPVAADETLQTPTRPTAAQIRKAVVAHRQDLLNRTLAAEPGRLGKQTRDKADRAGRGSHPLKEATRAQHPPRARRLARAIPTRHRTLRGQRKAAPDKIPRPTVPKARANPGLRTLAPAPDPQRPVHRHSQNLRSVPALLAVLATRLARDRARTRAHRMLHRVVVVRPPSRRARRQRNWPR